MNKYNNFPDFQLKNKSKFDEVSSSILKLKSMSELAQTGSALTEAEKLTFDFLNLSSICTDLLFGLSGSVLHAKSKRNEEEGLFFRNSDVKSAADKAKLVLAEPAYLLANANHNDLNDLFEYLQMKKKDFDAAYYYYRDISTRK